MSHQSEQFLEDAEQKVFDPEHRRKLAFNIGQYDKKVVEGKHQFADLELARQRASSIKYKVLENLDKYLIEFEANYTRRGGKVIWAQDAEEAVNEVLRIARAERARSIVKSKSMTTEEIHVNEALEKEGIESVETDLGEYIVQLRKEHPYHIVTPAMHLDRNQIRDLFREKLGEDIPDADPQKLVALARRKLQIGRAHV